MKILYYSDKYAYDVMGTKRSIFEEMKSRRIAMIWKDESLINSVLSHIEQEKPTQVWLAGSDIILSQGSKKKIKISVIAFGMSDPFMFSKNRLDNCDVYVTNWNEMINRWGQYTKALMIYNPPACDFRFHKKLDVPKRFDITVIGCGIHSRFKNQKGRIEIVNRLREDGFDVWAFGNNWPKHPKNNSHIGGQDFLKTINSSKIGLDITGETFPLSHRTFEYSACGVPVVTRHRLEVLSLFEKDIEIKTYTNYESLKQSLLFLLMGERYKGMGENALRRCQKDHNISNRVDHILSQLRGWI